MATNNELLIGGDKVSVPMMDPTLRQAGQVTTPEWMVSIDELFESDIKDFETFVELYGWHAEASRETNGNVSGDLVSSASVKQSDVIIIVPMGVYMPLLDDVMQTGKVLGVVTIVRIGSINTTKKEIQRIEFRNCQVTRIEQRLEDAVVTFRPVMRTNIVYRYNNEGLSEGQTVSEFDYSKGE